MTISREIVASSNNEITPESVLLAAYDIIGRIFSQEAVIKAYYNTDPDTMDLRESENISD